VTVFLNLTWTLCQSPLPYLDTVPLSIYPTSTLCHDPPTPTPGHPANLPLPHLYAVPIHLLPHMQAVPLYLTRPGHCATVQPTPPGHCVTVPLPCLDAVPISPLKLSGHCAYVPQPTCVPLSSEHIWTCATLPLPHMDTMLLSPTHRNTVSLYPYPPLVYHAILHLLHPDGVLISSS
jgi:hypothetical protein